MNVENVNFSYELKYDIENLNWCCKSKVEFELGIAEWNLSRIFELEYENTNWITKKEIQK